MCAKLDDDSTFIFPPLSLIILSHLLKTVHRRFRKEMQNDCASIDSEPFLRFLQLHRDRPSLFHRYFVLLFYSHSIGTQQPYERRNLILRRNYYNSLDTMFEFARFFVRLQSPAMKNAIILSFPIACIT